MFRITVTAILAALLAATTAFPNSLSNKNEFQVIVDDIRRETGIHVSVEDLRIFKDAGMRHGVHWQVLVSQWYQESKCGANMGSSNPEKVLASEPKQLAALRKILANLGRKASQIKAGGCGELGPMQFRPTIWLAYGKDLNGDGKPNPWDLREVADAAARFLKEDCGYEGRNTVFGALAHYNGGYRRSWTNEHYANTVARRADRWGAPLDL